MISLPIVKRSEKKHVDILGPLYKQTKILSKFHIYNGFSKVRRGCLFEILLSLLIREISHFKYRLICNSLFD